MKRIIYVMIAVLMIVSLASCNLSKTEEDTFQSSTKKLIRVSVSRAQTRSLSTSYGEDVTVKYRLKASANFERDRAIVGESENGQFLVEIDDNQYDAGFFEQGSWNFILEAVLTDGDEVTSEVIASDTKNNVNITSKNNKITFTLSDIKGQNEKGTLSFSILVPRVSDYDETAKDYGVCLDVTVGTGNAVSFSEATLVNQNNEDMLKFEGTISNVDAGSKNVTFNYRFNLSDPDECTDTICAQNIEVRIVGNVTANVQGSMMNGAYASGVITVEYATENWTPNFNAASLNATVASGQTKKLTCVIEGTGANNPSYQWYVDGGIKDKEENADYTITAGAPGVYCVTCVVTSGSISKSVSTYLTVTKAVN